MPVHKYISPKFLVNLSIITTIVIIAVKVIITITMSQLPNIFEGILPHPLNI